MYVASLDALGYEIHSIGKTKEDCQRNMVIGFARYVEHFHNTVAEWIEYTGVDFNDYDNDIWTFLSEYYGVHIFDITKGYALGWE